MRSKSILVSVLIPVSLGLSSWAHGQEESTCASNSLHLPCEEANPGVGGCEDPDCCWLVCADFNALCCEDVPLGWIQQCANFAIQIGCAACSSELPLDPGVSLYAQLDLNDLGGAANGNDCWGYVSPTGREYALMGVSNALKVVEITDPSNPVIIGTIPHPNTLWADVKTYQTYAYVVNDGGGGGLDVVDLSDVDNGNVTVVPWADDFSNSHNVAIDTTSGYLYLCGANIHGGRLVAYDLSNPDNPVQVEPFLHSRAQTFTMPRSSPIPPDPTWASRSPSAPTGASVWTSTT